MICLITSALVWPQAATSCISKSLNAPVQTIFWQPSWKLQQVFGTDFFTFKVLILNGGWGANVVLEHRLVESEARQGSKMQSMQTLTGN